MSGGANNTGSGNSKLPDTWYRNDKGEVCHDGKCFSIRFGDKPVIEVDPECSGQELIEAMEKAVKSGDTEFKERRRGKDV